MHCKKKDLRWPAYASLGQIMLHFANCVKNDITWPYGQVMSSIEINIRYIFATALCRLHRLRTTRKNSFSATTKRTQQRWMACRSSRSSVLIRTCESNKELEFKPDPWRVE